MRRFALAVGLILLVLVTACGARDDPADGDGDASGNVDSAVVSASSTAVGDFCSAQHTRLFFDGLDFTSLGDSEQVEALTEVGDALDEWAGRAPAEIAGDVAVLARGMRGLIDLLEEYDFDLVALADAESEPRLQALENPEFEAASLRVSLYCGLPPSLSIGGVDSSPTGSTGGGSATGSDSSAVPDDFPRELVPPDSTVVVVGSAGFGFGPTVEFTSTADTADVFAHYEEVLGAPTFVESGGTSWSFITDTGLVTISITGTDGAVAIQIIIVINE